MLHSKTFSSLGGDRYPADHFWAPCDGTHGALVSLIADSPVASIFTVVKVIVSGRI
ncbi:hypothetical protein ARUE_c03670 [Arthrobacter sp. Rue61a]|nr:hypothetical protein ARUE_c03670 [Arthrobacter sp. Rue61a]